MRCALQFVVLLPQCRPGRNSMHSAGTKFTKAPADGIVKGVEKRNLVGASMAEIEDLVGSLHEAPFRARQIFSGVYRRRIRSLDELTDLGKDLRARLRNSVVIEYPQVVRVFQSRDGTRRYLFEILPGQKIESVFIPEEHRDTFCISTQVGCAVGCVFCVTGKLPMRRNLTAGEIVGQVLALQTDRGTLPKRLNVVIMGMGEPLLNYDNVMAAIRLMTDTRGVALSPRRITLSTSGILPGLRRLGEEPVIPNLAISLNATTDEVRDVLIPINRKWNIASLIAACRDFPLEKRRRITFEYVLIGGVNDTPDDAHRLVSLLRGLKKKVNLIPLNADPWIPLRAPAEVDVLAFQKILVDHHITASIRRPRGDDVSAACGMLAGREQPSGEDLPPISRRTREIDAHTVS